MREGGKRREVEGIGAVGSPKTKGPAKPGPHCMVLARTIAPRMTVDVDGNSVRVAA